MGEGQILVSHRPAGLSSGDLDRIGGFIADEPLRSDSDLQHEEWTVGGLLTWAYLQGAVGNALAGEVEHALVRGSTLELALEIEQPLAALPWETLRAPASVGQAPGRPLALLPQVLLHRFIAAPEGYNDDLAPGPLQVMAVVGRPAHGGNRGLSTEARREAQLEAILDMLTPARRQGGALIHLLEEPSLSELEAVLRRLSCPVVHLACEVSGDGILLSLQPGSDRELVSFRLVAEVLADAGVSLIVLAGSTPGPPAQERNILLGGAYWLVSTGLKAACFIQPAAPAAFTRVFWSTMYLGLATGDRTDPLASFSHARLMLESARRRPFRQDRDQGRAYRGTEVGGIDGEHRREPPEWWHAPVLILGSVPLPLYDGSVRFDSTQPERELRMERGGTIWPAAAMRGRCRELRELRRGLDRAGGGGGVLLLGSRGVGKSVLAERICADLSREGWAVCPVVGRVDVETIFEAIARGFSELNQGANRSEALEEIAGELVQLDLSWEERFELLSDEALEALTLLVVFDDFEENLARGNRVRDPALADMLAHWLSSESSSRVLVVCSVPFYLPADAQARLSQVSLGPFSPARARLLALGLPGLDLLEPEELVQACTLAGGHPRVLARMSALLRRGRRTFGELSQRLREDMAARGIVGPDGWWNADDAESELSLAIENSEIAHDVLDDLTWEELEWRPLARRLLAGASVFRRPVDETGLVRQLTEDSDSEAVPAGFPASLSMLEDLRLLARLDVEGEPPKYLVPRWVVPLVEQRNSEATIVRVHHRAARYWRWWGDTACRVPAREATALLEARYHHFQAEERELAVAATTAVCLRYHLLSAWSRLDPLIRRTLRSVPKDSPEAARFHHILGLSAAGRGDYGDAVHQYRLALGIHSEHGLRAVLAVTCHQLGLVSEERGEEVEALEWYGRALEIEREVGDLAGQADTCLRIGRIDRGRGDEEGARRWYRRALKMLRDLDDEPLIMATLNSLGQLSGDCGDWDKATEWYGQVLETGDHWSEGHDLVANFHLLGFAAQNRGDYGEAFLWFRQALEIEDSRGDRIGVARSLRRLGRIAELCGDLDGALEWYRRSVVVEVEQGLEAHLARTTFRVAVLTAEHGQIEESLPLVLRAMFLTRSLGQPIDVELATLRHLGQQLGAGRFFALLDPHLDAQSLDELLDVLDM